MIQNAATKMCLHITEQNGEYSSNGIVDALWSVGTTTCDTNSQSQYWYWNTEKDQIIHNSTQLCLTSTIMGTVVLNNCEFANWRMEFLCAGNYIEHPQTEECISVKEEDYTTDGIEEELEELLLNVVNTMVVIEQCNVTNIKQTWRTFQQNSSNNSAIVDSTICNSHGEHELRACYNETLIDSQGWLRCQKHGYFVAGIHYYKGLTRAISKLYCCQSPYSYWQHPFLNPVDHSSIVCAHETRWTSVTESKVECKNDEYVRGIKLIEIDTLDYSLMSTFECCHPAEQKRVYRHCYMYSSIYDQKCSQSGYFVTSLMEIVSPNERCEKKLKCCV